MDVSPGNITYALYEDMSRKPGEPLPKGRNDYRAYVKWAIPFMVGDSYNGRRIVGTSPQMFGFNDDGTPAQNPFEYRKGRWIAEGKRLDEIRPDEAVGRDRRYEPVVVTHSAPSTQPKRAL